MTYVFIIRYSDSSDDSVQSQVIDTVSEYFLNFSRIDRIPKSDLVKIISNIIIYEINLISRFSPNIK